MAVPNGGLTTQMRMLGSSQSRPQPCPLWPELPPAGAQPHPVGRQDQPHCSAQSPGLPSSGVEQPVLEPPYPPLFLHPHLRRQHRIRKHKAPAPWTGQGSRVEPPEGKPAGGRDTDPAVFPGAAKAMHPEQLTQSRRGCARAHPALRGSMGPWEFWRRKSWGDPMHPFLPATDIHSRPDVSWPHACSTGQSSSELTVRWGEQ